MRVLITAAAVAIAVTSTASAEPAFPVGDQARARFILGFAQACVKASPGVSEDYATRYCTCVGTEVADHITAEDLGASRWEDTPAITKAHALCRATVPRGS